jgi:hypothetical protein
MFLKDPDSTLDYRVDWAGALTGAQTIVSSRWAVEPAGVLMVVGQAVEPQAAVVRLSGGLAGHVYRVGNRVTLSDGTVDERSLVLRVEHR